MRDQNEVAELVVETMLPTWRKERERLDRIDGWLRWDHDKPHQPRHSTTEYKELAARSQTPWLALVVTSVAQALYVDGYRQPSAEDNSTPWAIWQANGFDARQIAVHRAAIAYGASYVTVLPGKTMTGQPMPVMRGVSPRRMVAFYEDAAEDDWPTMALRADILPGQKLRLRVYDETHVYDMVAPNTEGTISASDIVWREPKVHEIGFCPVVRFANALDLEGRTDGEVEPFIPVAGRIDQTTFDRLVVQRFSSWVVRTIAGMAKPEVETDAEMEKLRLRAEDILIAEDKDTKFGHLPASSLDGFIAAHKSDVQALAAVSQTPAHELLGEMSNLSAEALAAARASLTAKVEERKSLFGEAHENVLRLAALVAGDTAAAEDYSSEVRWRDTEIRSLAQAADALGKLATMLGVPVEVLWEKIPGWTEQDVEHAKSVAQQPGSISSLVQEMLNGATAASAEPAPTLVA